MTALRPEELEARLRDIGARRYHRLHPFHKLLHGGACSKGQVQAWALNRYYYQAMIPVKDASLIARCDDAAIRREWRSRLVDHDGVAEGDGGIARWLKLTDGLLVHEETKVQLELYARENNVRRGSTASTIAWSGPALRAATQSPVTGMAARFFAR